VDTDTDKDKEAIRELVRTWGRATAAGDLEAVLALMSEDVVFLVPGQPPFGKQAFKASMQGPMKGARIDSKSDIEEIVVSGDVAYLRNHLEVTMTPPQGPAARRKGYTLTILRNQIDRRWLLVRDANLLVPVSE
jgi:uncharacterized protein (TIGR02246 family)